MPTKSAFAPSTVHVHNTACEEAAHANCQCFCHGAGHQFSLIQRAASCETDAELRNLEELLYAIYGGFHTGFRDGATPIRRGRTQLTPFRLAREKFRARGGATWAETLVLDEAVHTYFVQVACSSRATTDSARKARKDFITRITTKAINIVGSAGTAVGTAGSHVWCSIIAEFLAGKDPLIGTQPRRFDRICYPRNRQVKIPAHLASVRDAGLLHLEAEFNAPSDLSDAEKIELLRLAGMASCADPWHHSAVVRSCIEPPLTANTWPPANTTKIATPDHLKNIVKRRWINRGNW